MPTELVEALRAQLGARLIETHISWVLLAGDDAWKIKRPVRLPFLDFSTLESRRRMCEEELRLNRRLAPTLYLDVERITGDARAPRLGGAGPAIEYALHMRRFPDGALLAERLAAGDLPPVLIDRLAARIAAFHREAPVADAASPWGRPERVAGDMRDVIDRLAPLLSGERAAAIPRLRAWAEAEIPALHETWRRRREQGRVREGHGDLHLANTVVLGEEVTAFDCIEFDPALRWIDVQADTAFLVMDLLAHGRTDLAFRFLDRCLEAGGDHGGLAVLRWYLVYRALVRALAGALHPAHPDAAPDYLALARHWLSPPGARLAVMHGVSGSGKSRVAERLLEAAGAIRLRSDVERKRLFGLAPLADSGSPPGGGLYAAEASARTYARLRELAAIALRSGWPVIVDAGFLHAGDREDFRRLAREHGAPFTILHCEAPPALLRERVEQRSRRGGDVSEAGLAVLDRQLATAAPLTAAERDAAIVLDTTGTPDACALAARWATR